MSRRKHKRKRRPGQPLSDQARAAALLGRLATLLTHCERAGLAVKLRHGIVMTRAGYVLPLADGEWAARTLLYTEFTPAGDPVDDD